MTEENQNKTNMPKWAWGIILLLVLLVLLQGGILFSLLKERNQPVPEPVRTTYEPPAAASGLRSGQVPAGAAALDAFLADPFSTMARMESQMNRMMQGLLAYGGPAATGFDFAPSIDLEEKADHYLVRADLPGLEKDKIQVSVRGNLLTIQGVRQSGSESREEESGFYAREVSYGSFARTITLPGPVNEAGIQAQYENGVLQVTLPKAQGEKDTRKISVQ